MTDPSQETMTETAAFAELVKWSEIDLPGSATLCGVSSKPALLMIRTSMNSQKFAEVPAPISVVGKAVRRDLWEAARGGAFT